MTTIPARRDGSLEVLQHAKPKVGLDRSVILQHRMLPFHQLQFFISSSSRIAIAAAFQQTQAQYGIVLRTSDTAALVCLPVL
jgi:hypothetical protein